MMELQHSSVEKFNTCPQSYVVIPLFVSLVHYLDYFELIIAEYLSSI